MSGSVRHTLRDVAERAGVSYQTVSRVINNHPYVAAETRERILQAISELDYKPNLTARSLVARRSHTLAVITFGLNFYGPAQMVIHIERAARAAGYDLIFTSVAEPLHDSIPAALDALERRAVDGLILITPVPAMLQAEVEAFNGDLPIVLMDAPSDGGIASVSVDQRYGGKLAIQHLLDLGHTAIAEISGPLHWFGAQARHEAFLQTTAEAGLEARMTIEGDWSAISGYEAARALLASGVTFTGLVAGNDPMALGAIRALHEFGLRVPEDVSVIGFDDVPEAAFFEPPLTTIRQDFGRLGRDGIACLVERLENPHAPAEERLILPELMVRESTAIRR